MVSLDSLLIRGRHASLSALPSRLLPVLRRYSAISPLLLRSGNIHVLALMRLVLLSQGFVAGLVVHVVVRDSPVLTLVVGYGLVFIIV